MIGKFAFISGKVPSEFLDLNHTSRSMIPVSLMIPKLAPEPGDERGRASVSGHWYRYGVPGNLAETLRG
jgi:hypothetical protein